IVRIVKHEFRPPALEPGPDRTEAAGAERIDDRGRGSRRKLEEVDPISIAMEARGLGIDSDHRFLVEPSEKIVEARIALDELEWNRAHSGSTTSAIDGMTLLRHPVTPNSSDIEPPRRSLLGDQRSESERIHGCR